MKSDRLMRVGYSFLGLLAGDAALLFLVLFKSFCASLQQHGKLMALLLKSTLEWFGVVAIVSIAGWIMIGVPAVLILSPGRTLKTSRLLLVLVGALLGPLALLFVFLLLSRGKLSSATFTQTTFLWACASVISTIAFGVHCTLVRRTARIKLKISTELSAPE
jgi:hypothetical protein